MHCWHTTDCSIHCANTVYTLHIHSPKNVSPRFFTCKFWKLRSNFLAFPLLSLVVSKFANEKVRRNIFGECTLYWLNHSDWIVVSYGTISVYCTYTYGSHRGSFFLRNGSSSGSKSLVCFQRGHVFGNMRWRYWNEVIFLKPATNISATRWHFSIKKWASVASVYTAICWQYSFSVAAV